MGEGRGEGSVFYFFYNSRSRLCVNSPTQLHQLPNHLFKNPTCTSFASLATRPNPACSFGAPVVSHVFNSTIEGSTPSAAYRTRSASISERTAPTGTHASASECNASSGTARHESRCVAGFNRRAISPSASRPPRE